MPWYNGNYPPSYKNQPLELREKAVEIANQLLEQGTEEGIAIATGLKRARIFFKKQQEDAIETKAISATQNPAAGKKRSSASSKRHD